MAEVARSSGSSQAEMTRQQLVSTAEQLFAEQGLDAVSLAQINRAAGQRNATALHYHFGGKQGLLQAIFDKHTPRVNTLRGQMLAQLADDADLKELVAVLVVPLAEQVRDADGGCCYLQFLAQVINNPALSPESVDQRSDPVLDAQRSRFSAALSQLPTEVRDLRIQYLLAMVFNSLAAYARQVQKIGLDSKRHQLMLEQLVEAATGALRA
jgi:AcrR family transcriptional regulator